MFRKAVVGFMEGFYWSSGYRRNISWRAYPLLIMSECFSSREVYFIGHS